MFLRPQGAELARRLAEPRLLLQWVTGPRQVGKTTLVQQVTEAQRLPVRSASADEQWPRDSDWLARQWKATPIEAADEDADKGGILVVDGVQKVEHWSDTVKRL
jgi:predicted AAA+ superfamily ATPase